MPVSTDLPGKLDFTWYSRNDHTIALTFPATLAGRTFEVRIAAETAITVTVNVAVATFTVPALSALVKPTQRQAWSFVETTGADVTLIGGTIAWGLGYDDEGDEEAFNVTVSSGDAVSVAVSGSVALAAEAAARTTADSILAAAITAETTRATAAEATKQAAGTYLSLVAAATGVAATDTAALTAALALPRAGGRIVTPAGIYLLNAGLVVPSNSRWDGVPGQRGNGDYTNGTCLKWAGATGQVILSFFAASMAVVDGINVFGNSIDGLTGVLFDSINAPASKYPRLENFSIASCGSVATPGYGVQVGRDAVAAYQADTWVLRHGDISHCVIGVSVDSSNAGYQGIIEHVDFSAHARGVQVISSGNFSIRDCEFGGHGADLALVADIIFEVDGAGHGGTGAQVLIENCQTQNGSSGSTYNAGYFLLVDASCTADLTFPITVQNCRINDVGIMVRQTKRLILVANVFTNACVVLAAGAPTVVDIGCQFNGTGVRTISDGVLISGGSVLTSATAAFVSTDVGKRVVNGGSDTLGTPVLASSVSILPVGTLITAVYTAATAPAAARATAYTVGQVVRPTAANTHLYQCTTAGTSHASTEPTWPTTAGNTVTDGTVTWTCLATGVTAAVMDNAATGAGTGLSVQLDYGYVIKAGTVTRYGSNGMSVNTATAPGVGPMVFGDGGAAFAGGIAVTQGSKFPFWIANTARDRALGVDSSGTKIDNAAHIRSGTGVPALSSTLGDLFLRTDVPGFYFNRGTTDWVEGRLLDGAAQPLGNNYTGWTYDEILASSSQGVLSAGVLLLARMRATTTGALNNVIYYVNVIATSPTSGQNFVGVYDGVSGTLLGTSADQTTNYGVTGRKNAALTAPSSSVLIGTPLLVALLFNGTTGPTLRGVANNPGGNNGGSGALTAANLRYATYGTGQTSLPGSITIASLVGNGNAPWAAVA